MQWIRFSLTRIYPKSNASSSIYAAVATGAYSTLCISVTPRRILLDLIDRRALLWLSPETGPTAITYHPGMYTA
jgi:hypothetical protein